MQKFSNILWAFKSTQWSRKHVSCIKCLKERIPNKIQTQVSSQKGWNVISLIIYCHDILLSWSRIVSHEFHKYLKKLPAYPGCNQTTFLYILLFHFPNLLLWRVEYGVEFTITTMPIHEVEGYCYPRCRDAARLSDESRWKNGKAITGTTTFWIEVIQVFAMS